MTNQQIHELSERELAAILGYDTQSLETGIEKAKENIKLFEEAIRKELDTIEEYQNYILIKRVKRL